MNISTQECLNINMTVNKMASGLMYGLVQGLLEQRREPVGDAAPEQAAVARTALAACWQLRRGVVLLLPSLGPRPRPSLFRVGPSPAGPAPRALPREGRSLLLPVAMETPPVQCGAGGGAIRPRPPPPGRVAPCARRYIYPLAGSSGRLLRLGGSSGHRSPAALPRDCTLG